MTTETPARAAGLELSGVTAEEYPDFWRSIMVGFHDKIREDDLEFDLRFTEHDRNLGFRDGTRWVSTAGAFSRSVTVPGGADVPMAAVSIVTVAPTHRRRGLLTAMMRHQLDDVRARGTEPIAALYASESLIYGRFGYSVATRHVRLSGRTREMVFRPGTDLGDGVISEVDRDELIAGARPVYDRLRTSNPGRLDRDDRWWEWRLFDAEHARDGASPMRYVLHTEPDGSVTGWAAFRIKQEWEETGPNCEVRIKDFGATHPAAHAKLWRFLFDLDLVRRFDRHSGASLDEPLLHLLANPRAVVTKVGDALYVRMVDIERALAARRYAAELDVVIDVTDQFCPWNAGRYRLRGGIDGAECTRTDAAADLSLSSNELSSAYLGGFSLAALARAGRVVERTPGSLARASVGFSWPTQPATLDGF